MFDYIIVQAHIVDGTGEPGYTADIGIKNDRINAIGSLKDENARLIPATGLVCCPGFIDMHSHTDLEFFQSRPPEAKVKQGITTELLGQDGLGTAPVSAPQKPLLAGLLAGLNGQIPDEKWDWHTFTDYLEALTRQSLPNNVAALVSHGPVRIAGLGMAERDAQKAELAAMTELVREAMAAGAFGFSTGLIYPPCSYASTDELIALNREVAAYDGIFVVHQRDEGYNLARSFDEVCAVSRRSGARLHVSHLQAYGRQNWPIMDEVLTQADRFIHDGGRVTWDRYPYLAGSTVLTAVLPTWTLNEGPEALASNLTDPNYRAKIHQAFEAGLEVWHNRQISVGWENIFISALHLAHNQWMVGRSCQEVATQLDKNPIDMVCDLLAEEKLAVTMISFYGSETILEKVLNHEQATVGSDGIFGGRPHPRLFGTYPRFIKSFVGEKKLLNLEQAVRKISGFPAQILGIRDRGLIKKGYFADLVIFNPDTIADAATYEEPQAFPHGIHSVLVNGIPVVDQEKMTGNYPGAVIRKS